MKSCLIQNLLLQLYKNTSFVYVWWTHGCFAPGKGNLPLCLICDKAFNSSWTCLILQFRKQNVPNQTGQGLLEYNIVTIKVISLVDTVRPVVKDTWKTLLSSEFQWNISLSAYKDSKFWLLFAERQIVVSWTL